MKSSRRDFLMGSAMMAAAGVSRSVVGDTASEAAKAAVASDAAFMNTMAAGRLICSEPMLQVPAETPMGVVWAVTAMANGWVDVSEHPDLSNARRYTCGGFGLTGFHERVLQVRLTDLKPAMTYYYRIRADRIDYRSDGNHENRGKWARRLHEVLMTRIPSERPSRDWALTRNFAVRIGDIALIGLDTGDDRGDEHPLSAGLANFQAYRQAQTPWLADALSRTEIASAPFLLASCYIPLLPRASESDNPMWWTKYGRDNWGPLLTAAKAQAVLVGHMHEYRFDPSVEGRSWAQIEGGGYELGKRRFGAREIVNPGYFPTVMDVRAEDGKLLVEVWDVWRDRVVGRHQFAAR